MLSHARQVFERPASEEQIRAFQEWEQRNAARMLLRYADFPNRSAFGLRPSDVVTIDRHVRFDFTGSEPRLLDESGTCVGTIANAPVGLLQRFLAALDGQRSIAAICSEQPFAQHAGSLQALVEALLGGPFLIPASVDELESRLPAVELIRYPSQSPYAMPRQYWENSIAVRQALDELYSRANDFGAFADGLRGLHRLATLGANGRNYYGGAGGVATVPGEFRNTPLSNRFSPRKKWIFERWLRLLDVTCELVNSGSIVSSRDVPLTRIAEHGSECHHASGRDLLASQLNELRVHLAAACAALGTDRDRLLRHCALFHHAFAHAHPFGNINNSIAMNIVNDLLGRAGVGVIPHLYFDQVAYFLQPEAYVRLFERGVEAHVMNAEVGRDRRATAALLEIVANAPSAA
jgi:hypothetical protein